MFIHFQIARLQKIATEITVCLDAAERADGYSDQEAGAFEQRRKLIEAAGLAELIRDECDDLAKQARLVEETRFHSKLTSKP